ncbi:MAG: DNA-binding transcriptional regulator OxyR [Gammaproteobacteria bacterium]
MNLNDLAYLVAIEEEQHFKKAAARCFVSQPTLSSQLKKLEEELGVLLVERTNRRVRMTDIGTVIADQARQILGQTNALRDIARSHHDPMVGDLHVGIIPTIAPYLLPLVMPVLGKSYPKLKLWLHEHRTDTLLNYLRQGKLDLLLLALPVQSREFVHLDLFKEPFRLAVSQEDPLFNKRELNLTDLDHREVLLLEEGHCLRGQALEVCLESGANENMTFKATSLETLRQMVGEGMGITLVPELAVPKRIKKWDRVRYLPFVNSIPARRIGLLYRSNSYREITFKKMAELIKVTIKL